MGTLYHRLKKIRVKIQIKVIKLRVIKLSRVLKIEVVISKCRLNCTYQGRRSLAPDELRKHRNREHQAPCTVTVFRNRLNTSVTVYPPSPVSSLHNT
ncbi:MAG: hypothetical protein JXK93_06115, partial [Sphaerochaetaceae bacterium]|nr:hypothetical protein [Sphaerochaetaceae bacterium]